MIKQDKEPSKNLLRQPLAEKDVTIEGVSKEVHKKLLQPSPVHHPTERLFRAVGI